MVSPSPLLVKLATPLPIHTPLSVTASSPLPVAIATPLHVYMADSGISIATLVFAVLAFGAGFAAVIMTYLDLRNQREQMKEFRRHAILDVRLTLKPSNVGWLCHINLFNIGDRTTAHYRLRLYFPEDTHINSLGINFQGEGRYYLAPTVIGGERYLVFEHPLPHDRNYQPERRLYINDDGYEVDRYHIDMSKPLVILWDADDDYGHYPKDQRYGALLVQPIPDPKPETELSSVTTMLPEHVRRAI